MSDFMSHFLIYFSSFWQICLNLYNFMNDFMGYYCQEVFFFAINNTFKQFERLNKDLLDFNKCNLLFY